MRNLMTRTVSKLALFALVLAVAVALVGAQPTLAFDNGDGRYNPDQNDRLAVYVRDGGIEVWGIDVNTNGVYLAAFSAAELASGEALTVTTETGGTISVKQTKSAVIATNYDENGVLAGYTVTESAAYTVAWVDPMFGADGQGVFTKEFEATYLN